ncbi:MAG: DNA-binding response regulator [Cytophagales bacterium]|nr:MAG: DNA-binding response regulator [Cytophagales bacterium]
MFKTIIVEDDLISAELIKHFALRTDFLEVVAIFNNGEEALKYLLSNEVDIALLDVNLPGMNGVDIIKSLNIVPQIILITADINYGPQAFEFNVVDYLLKPVEYTRFFKAINKAVERIGEKETVSYEQNNIFIKANNRLVNLQYSDILYVEALSDYVTFCTKEKKYIVHSTMKDLESKLPNSKFIRVHRSFIVNLSKIETIEDSCIVINKQTIAIGVTYKDALLNKLNFL